MNKLTTYLIVVVLLVMAFPASGSDVKLLENAYILHTRLLDEESKRYARALEREQEVMQRLISETAALDLAVADQSIPVAELRRREADLADVRGLAFTRSAATAAARDRLYTRLDGLYELGVEIERERSRDLIFTDRIDGVWRIEVLPMESFGVVSFEAQGTMISGIYRMSTGSRGSFKGTRTGKSVKLERFDAAGGNDAVLKGFFDPDTGVITGTWEARKLGQGGPEAGTWTARKLAPGEDPEETLEGR